MVLGFRKRGDEPSVTEATPVETDTGRATGVENSESLNVEENVDQLKKFKKTHQWDYNLDYDQIDTVNRVLESDDVEKKAHLEQSLLEENSPYFEVRASVRNYDE